MRARRARRAVAEPGPQALAVLAGLPAGIAEAAAKRLTAAQPSWRAVSVPFPTRDESVYTQDRTIHDLMLQSAFFAAALPTGAASIPSPARILLLPVELPGCQRLLDAFGFSVVSAPLRIEGWEWRGGRHWRHDIDATMQAIESATRIAQEGWMGELHRLLLGAATDDVLKLPGRNFHVGDERLAERFARFLSGTMTVADVREAISIRRFNRDDLPSFFRRTGGDQKRFCIDARGLVFCSSPRGQHGPSRTLGDEECQTIAGLRSFLEGLYRFGTPLRSAFQHDVQWERDRPLDREAFDCTARGQILVSASHANVYANDVVRPG